MEDNLFFKDLPTITPAMITNNFDNFLVFIPPHFKEYKRISFEEIRRMISFRLRGTNENIR